METDREEEREGQRHATGGRDAGPQAEEGAETDGDLGQRDHDPDRNREAQQMAEDQVQRADPDGRDQLRLNAAGAVGIEEVRVGQFLEAGEEEREAEESAQWQRAQPERENGCGGGPS